MRSASHRNSVSLPRLLLLLLVHVAISQQTVVGHAVTVQNDRQTAVSAAGLRGSGPVGSMPKPETAITDEDETDPTTTTTTSRQLQGSAASQMSLSPLTIITNPSADSGTTPMEAVVGSEATFQIVIEMPPSSRRMTAADSIEVYEQDDDEEENEEEWGRELGKKLFQNAATKKSLFVPAVKGRANKGRGKPGRRGRTLVIDAVIFVTEDPSGERVREDGKLEEGEGDNTLRYSCTMSGSLDSVGMWRTRVVVRTRWVRDNDRRLTTGRISYAGEMTDEEMMAEDKLVRDEDLVVRVEEGRRRLATVTSEWVEYSVIDAPTGPTAPPSSPPSSGPTPAESASPTISAMPTVADSSSPSVLPSVGPSASAAPSHGPSQDPTLSSRPSYGPSSGPSLSAGPSLTPSTSPTTSSKPSSASSSSPSVSSRPTRAESTSPSASLEPSASPSGTPSLSYSPSASPSQCQHDDDCIDAFNCTIDACVNGACSHEANNTACDDQNFCTQDTCSVDAGCVYATGPMDNQTCDDRNLFTNGDVCESGVCAGTHSPSTVPSAVPSTLPTTSTAPSDGPTAPPSSSPSSGPSVSAQPSPTPSQSPTASQAPSSNEMCDISISISNLDDPSPTAVSSGSDPVSVWDWGYFEDGDRKPLYSAEYSDEGSNLTFWGNATSLDYSMIHFYKNIPLPEDLRQGCDVPAERQPMEFCFSANWTYWVGNSTDGGDPSIVYDQPTTFTNEGGASKIQGIEFSASRWECGYRNEIAMQWENVADGTWRYWYPTTYSWIALPDTCNITQAMSRPAFDTEHVFELCAIIDGKNINYTTMNLNDDVVDLESCMAHIDVPILLDNNTATLLAGAIQLDGTATNHPFRVYTNDMNLEYKCPEEPTASPSSSPSTSSAPSSLPTTSTAPSDGTSALPSVSPSSNPSLSTSPSFAPTQCTADTDCTSTDLLTCSVDACIDGFCTNKPNLTAAIIDEDFEGVSDCGSTFSNRCNGWFSDGGLTGVVNDGSDTYFRSYDRGQPWHGPKIEIHPLVDCIANNTRYELYARVRLVKSGGTSDCTNGIIDRCPGLTFQYKELSTSVWVYESLIDKTSPPGGADNEWFEMTAVIDFVDKYPDLQTFYNGRIYIQNPEAGVEIHLDRFSFTAVLPLDHGVIAPANNSKAVILPDPPAPTADSLLVGNDRTDCPHERGDLLDWHDASIWPGSLIPTSGDVTLPPNASVIIRSSITGINGTITVPATSELIIGEDTVNGIEIDASGIEVLGSFIAGSESCRIEAPITITLHGSRPVDRNINGTSLTAIPTYKGISVRGGTLNLHGKRYSKTWVRLAETIRPGDDTAHLQHPVNWEVGQQVVLVSTAMRDDRAWHQNEVRIITAIVADPGGVGSIITFDEPCWNTHIANEYYQGEVGLLSRTIVIQGSETDSQDADDVDDGTYEDSERRYTVHQVRSAPNPDKNLRGFGGHIMIWADGKGFVEGVELYRMGQTNFLGRYPIHYHRLGNSCDGCYFRDSSIHKSFYRCISIHATHNLTVAENVGYDITGYCYYLEDGVEEDNTLSFNLGAHIHYLGQAPFGGGQQVTGCGSPGVDCSGLDEQSKDRILPADSTASAFYITNIHNDIVGNVASGGWAGFAFPILPFPIGASYTDSFRPSSVTAKSLDGNTAHSTGWWWGSAAAFYFGGHLYYENGLLQYDPGRGATSSNRNRRRPCLVDKCATTGSCDSWCTDDEQAWIRMTNTKTYQTAGIGLNSWSGSMEVIGIEAHDVGLSLAALEPGFWIDSLVATCRTGEVLAMPKPDARGVRGDGFVWYDTGQEHIMTQATFKNCGYRSSLDNAYDQYDNSTTRGCYNDDYNGCSSGSSVFGSLAHSDEFNPEIMQATKGITFDNCGRRFKLVDFRESGKEDPSVVPSSVSGRIQNWFDVDGSLIGTNEPTIAASGEPDAASWWVVEDDVIQDTQGPMVFILQDNGPARGIGHINLKWDHRPADNDGPVSIHERIGQTYGECSNGNSFNSTVYTPCTTRGYIKHIGPYFDGDSGLPVTAKSEIAGMVGGFGWLFTLDEGAPVELRVNDIEVFDDTPLLLSLQYPVGTNVTVSGSISLSSRAALWSRSSICRSFAHHYNETTGLLTVRIVGVDRFFSRGNITLPRAGGVVYINADCVSTDGVYCDDAVTPIAIDPCPSGYNQTAYDTCCSFVDTSDCQDVADIYAVSTTPVPTPNATSNLLSDPSFEGVCDGGKPWVKSGDTTVFSYDDTESNSGSRCAKVSNRPQSYSGIRQSVTEFIIPGKQYNISACTKLVSVDDIRVMVKVSVKTTNKTDYYGGWSELSNSTHWTCHAVTISVDSEWPVLDANIYAETPNGSLDDFYIDDVSLIQL